MTKLDFHHFHVRHFNNVFEQSWCHCRVGATPASRSNCLQTCRIHHQVKYRRKDANTCIEAAILFSGHPYIGRHYRATLITQATCQLTVVGALLYMADYIYYGVKVKPILSLCIRNLSLCPFAFLVFLLFWGVFCLFVVCACLL